MIPDLLPTPLIPDPVRFARFAIAYVGEERALTR